MQYQKVKSVSKEILSRGPSLEKVILKTMKACSEVVGSTLGPGGMSVVIERQEERLPPLITKDGVTVFKNLGFDDSSQHVIMEAARDAAVRTANEAGDGTTTATILAESFVRNTMEYCKTHPKVSPQRVVRTLEQTFKGPISMLMKGFARPAELGSIEGRRMLHAVAKISANGDTELADAVIKCFDLVGDEGNVTILESSGPSGYEVEKIEGYPIGMGYEDSCGAFYQGFVNNTGRMICELEKPHFILYHGKINDIYTVLGLFDKINTAAQAGQLGNNFVLVATGFSETVLAHLHTNFVTPGTPNVFPLLAPMSASKTGQYDFLLDMAALTGGRIFDPLDNTLDNGEVSDLGSTKGFEASRFRSAVIGFRDEILILERVEQLKTQLSGGVSQLDRSLIQERIGKLTQGIAKLKVYGASSGEVREKRDRAEDAICSVRGAIKHGALPGGGWTLLQLDKALEKSQDSIVRDVVCKSLRDPVTRLLTNAGYNQDEIINICGAMREGKLVFDVLEGEYVDPFNGGVLDSVPAVLEAIRNSVSIAALLGTCGGTVVFKRDTALERQEARDTNSFLRDINEADERP